MKSKDEETYQIVNFPVADTDHPEYEENIESEIFCLTKKLPFVKSTGDLISFHRLCALRVAAISGNHSYPGPAPGWRLTFEYPYQAVSSRL
jgi:hypothetical protein